MLKYAFRGDEVTKKAVTKSVTAINMKTNFNTLKKTTK